MQKAKQMKMSILFLIILAVQLVNVFAWGCRKEGYYIDELWSYGLANSYYQPFLQDRTDYMNRWHSADYFESYLIVEPEEVFSFDSVYYNQTQDVHPPFYYMLLHALSSCFVGEFSKYIGLAINFLFFAGTLWILYLTGCEYLGKERYTVLLAPLLYGFSVGG